MNAWNEPRNWKWMVPACLAALFGVISPWVWGRSEVLGWTTAIWAGILGFSALMNCWLYFEQHFTDLYEQRQRANAITPQTVMADHMRQLHPAAINVLAMYGRTTWMILPGGQPDQNVEWVIYGTKVTYGFIIEFLQSSTKMSCVPEWKFASEGAKRYAPEEMISEWCTDREQYHQFISLLYGLGRVTKAHGNLPAQWIPPWNPKNVAKTMGITLYEDELDKGENNG